MNAELTLPPHAEFNPDLGIYDLDWTDAPTRKSSGSYYTPSCLIECLLDHALTSITNKAGSDTHQKNTSLPSPLTPLPSFTICDPACGTGHFLIPAARRIARQLAAIHQGKENPTAELVQEKLCRVIEHCIYGVDIDPAAVELCKFNLWHEAGKPAELPAILDRRIRCDDGLFFPWRSAFPEVFAAGGFDAMIGNPPFVNAIEGVISPEMKKRLAAESRDLRGTADLAFHFVRLCHELAKAGGTVGLVLPKTFLNAEAAVKLRERLCRERPPSMIHIPRRAVYFPGASAYTCLLALGGDTVCSVSDDESPGEARWRCGVISHSNWWRSVQTILGNLEEMPSGEFVPLGQQFEVTASMTTGEAYAIKPFVRDDSDASGPKLVTTGLIDPFVCKWGQQECRYLGFKYAQPRIVAAADLPASLSARMHKATTRPKLIVAGLCDRFEAFLDGGGEYLGAVSTYSIFHPENSVEMLENLCTWLNSPRASALLRAEQGAASVGGGFMTLKKKTLQELPVPKNG